MKMLAVVISAFLAVLISASPISQTANDPTGVVRVMNQVSEQEWQAGQELKKAAGVPADAAGTIVTTGTVGAINGQHASQILKEAASKASDNTISGDIIAHQTAAKFANSILTGGLNGGLGGQGSGDLNSALDLKSGVGGQGGPGDLSSQEFLGGHYGELYQNEDLDTEVGGIYKNDGLSGLQQTQLSQDAHSYDPAAALGVGATGLGRQAQGILSGTKTLQSGGHLGTDSGLSTGITGVGNGITGTGGGLNSDLTSGLGGGSLGGGDHTSSLGVSSLTGSLSEASLTDSVGGGSLV